MIELVFFGMIGILGLFIGEVAKSRKVVKTEEVSEKPTVRRVQTRRFLRNK